MSEQLHQNEIAYDGDDPLIFVHMSKLEQNAFDELIEGPDGPEFDDEYGLRDYSALAPIFADPEIREFFAHAQRIEEGKISTEEDVRLARIRSLVLKEAPVKSHPFEEEPGEHNPLIKTVANMGQEGDTELSLLPYSVAKFLDSLIGGPNRNPETGYRQYAKLWKTIKKAARWALPVIGAIAGGPVGGAIGGAIGGLGAKRNKWGAVGKGALMGGLGGFGVHGMGAPMGMMGSAAPFQGMLGSTIQGLGSGIGSIFGAGGAPSASGLGSLFGSGQGTAPSIFPNLFGQQVAKEGAKKALEEGAKNAPGMLDSIGGLKGLGAISSIASIPLTIMAHRKESKQRKRLKEEAEASRRRQMLQLNDINDKMGMRTSVDDILDENRDTPDVFNQDYYRNAHRGNEVRFKKGGRVKNEYPIREIGVPNSIYAFEGHEKGQDDNIYTTVPSGTYIVHASGVGNLGDGNTRAGLNEVNNFVKEILHSRQHLAKGGRSKVRPPVDAAISAGEAPIPPEAVDALGGGSNARGAKILDIAIKKLQKHKSSNGEKLPPKARSLHQYLPKLPSLKPSVKMRRR